MGQHNICCLETTERKSAKRRLVLLSRTLGLHAVKQPSCLAAFTPNLASCKFSILDFRKKTCFAMYVNGSHMMMQTAVTKLSSTSTSHL